MRKAFNSHRKKTNNIEPKFDIKNPEHRALIAELARERQYPFHKKQKKGRSHKKKKDKKKEEGNGSKKERKFDNKYKQYEHKHKRGGKQFSLPKADNKQSTENPRENAAPEGASTFQGSSPHQNQGTSPNNVNPQAKRRVRGIKMALQNAFETIGTEFTLSIKNVKKAYRKKALSCHPDKGGDPEHFKALGSATEKIVLTISTLLGIFPEINPDT